MFGTGIGAGRFGHDALIRGPNEGRGGGGSRKSAKNGVPDPQIVLNLRERNPVRCFTALSVCCICCLSRRGRVACVLGVAS